MPYSWCTTRSPSAISVASAMNWSARLRRRGGREMRSPSRSCSLTSARRSATKPRSRPSVTRETEPAGLRRTEAQASSWAASLKPCSRSRLASRSREPRVQAATTIRRPSLRPAFGLAAQLVEHVDARAAAAQAALGEDRAGPAAAVDALGAVRPGERGEGQQRAEGQHLVPVGAGTGTAGPAAAGDTAPRRRAAWRCAPGNGRRSSPAAPPARHRPGGPG